MMKIHKEGRVFLTVLFLVFLGLNMALFFTQVERLLFDLSIIVTSIIFLFFLQFFRNPSRKIEVNEKQILAPADGKIVVIEGNIIGEGWHQKYGDSHQKSMQ